MSNDSIPDNGPDIEGLKRRLEEDKATASATSWDPKPGQQILGTAVGFDWPKVKATGAFLPIVILATADGQVRVPVGRVVLRNKLIEQLVQVGDDLLIEYLGPQPGVPWLGYGLSVDRHGDRDPLKQFTIEPPELSPPVARSDGPSGGDPWSGEPSNGDQPF